MYDTEYHHINPRLYYKSFPPQISSHSSRLSTRVIPLEAVYVIHKFPFLYLPSLQNLQRSTTRIRSRCWLRKRSVLPLNLSSQLSRISSLVTLLSYIICRLLCSQTWMLSHVDSLKRQIAPIPFLSVDHSLGISPRAWCNSSLRLHVYLSGQFKYSCNTLKKVGQTNKQELSWPDDLDRKRWKSMRRSAPDQLRSRPESILQRFHRSWTVQSHESYCHPYLISWGTHLSVSSPLSHKQIVLAALLIIQWHGGRLSGRPDSSKACAEITNNLWSSMCMFMNMEQVLGAD